MDLDYTVVPITKWPALLTVERRHTPFRTQNSRTGWMSPGVNWSATMETMARELKHLGGENVVLQMAVRPQDIRLDGKVRANARTPEHPGVILTFDSKYGSLSYPCDTFTGWKSNLRAIVMALEALRKVDRYGVTKHGEQYAGSRQIPSSTGNARNDPYEVLAVHSGGSVGEARANPRRAYRLAAKATHPDRGGDACDFDAVNAAAKTVGVA